VLVVVPEYGIVGGKNGATAVAEYGLDVFVSKDLDDHICATHPGSGERMLVSAVSGRLFAHFLVNVS
jgi:hypothetical protein